MWSQTFEQGDDSSQRHLVMQEKMTNDKYSLDAIPVEVLVLAFIEFVFVNTFAAVLWYMFGHH